MSFRLRVIEVEYDECGETVLTGNLESGQIGGGFVIRIPTSDHGVYESVITNIEGPELFPPPYHAAQVCDDTITVAVKDYPHGKDIPVQCVAEG